MRKLSFKERKLEVLRYITLVSYQFSYKLPTKFESGADFGELLEPVPITHDFSLLETNVRMARVGFTKKSRFNIDVYPNDLATLDGSNWLNDIVLDYYLSLVFNKSEVDLLFSSHFYNHLVSSEKQIKRKCTWYKSVDVFSFKRIFIPLIVDNQSHWILAMVDVNNSSVVLFDSLGYNRITDGDRIASYLERETVRRNISPRQWSVLNAVSIPEQKNGYDCGVFVCKTAEFLHLSQPLFFSQNDMPFFRCKMMHDILLS